MTSSSQLAEDRPGGRRRRRGSCASAYSTKGATPSRGQDQSIGGDRRGRGRGSVRRTHSPSSTLLRLRRQRLDTCPDGSIISLPCDGLPTTIDVSCAADRTTCTTARDGVWTIDESCVTTASATETLCECETSVNEPRYYSTASNARTLIGSYVANLTEEPDFRRAAYVLYALWLCSRVGRWHVSREAP